MSRPRTIAISTFVTALLFSFLLTACGSGSSSRPATTGRFLLAIDASTQLLSADAIAPNGSLPVQTTAGAFQQPSRLLTLGNNIYALNSGSDSISQFTISTGGALTVGPVVVTGSSPVQFAFDPTNQFLVVANQGAKSLSVYSVRTDGTLLLLSGDFPLTNAPLSMAFSGDLLYVANGTVIQGLRFRSSPATFTVVSNFTPNGATISYLLADSSGHLFATDLKTNTVLPFSISPATGSLTQLAVAPTGIGPVNMTLDGSGAFLYVVNNVSDDVSVFSVDAATGVLTKVSGSPFPTRLSQAGSIALDSQGGFLYVGGANQEVAVMQLNSSTGVPILIGIPVPRTYTPTWLAVIAPQ